jgi:hypothetical protein
LHDGRDARIVATTSRPAPAQNNRSFFIQQYHSFLNFFRVGLAPTSVLFRISQGRPANSRASLWELPSFASFGPRHVASPDSVLKKTPEPPMPSAVSTESVYRRDSGFLPVHLSRPIVGASCRCQPKASRTALQPSPRQEG